MYDEHITSRRAAEIAAQATSLWRLFLRSDEYGWVGSPRGFFNPEWVVDRIEDFSATVLFKFASDVVLARSGAKILLRPLDLVEADVLLGKARDRKTCISRWLQIQAPGGNIPVVAVLEPKYLPDRGPRDYVINKTLAWTWNVLHEIGHLLLHCHLFLIDGRLSHDHARPIAVPAEEEEAWFFAACIMGLASGNEAFNDRAKPDARHFGAPWELFALLTPPHDGRK